MKILILSKPRCGSTVFGMTLSELLGYKLISEPGFNFDLIQDRDDIICKIIYPSNLEQEKEVNYYLNNFNWDIIITLKRNELDSKISYAHALHFQKNGIDRPFHRKYRLNKEIKISQYIHNLYNKMESFSNSISFPKCKKIEISYELLFNLDRNIVKNELNKIFNFKDLDDVILEKLHPKNKYTNIDNKELVI